AVSRSVAIDSHHSGDELECGFPNRDAAEHGTNGESDPCGCSTAKYKADCRGRRKRFQRLATHRVRPAANSGLSG
ncbi:MAG: hypothetical protein ACREQX_12605, partial [Candidatus Binataceae bacterium]